VHLAPCLPEHWEAIKIHYRYRETVYHITIVQTPAGDSSKRSELLVTVDGVEQDGKAIPLVDDHVEHTVEVYVPME